MDLEKRIEDESKIVGEKIMTELEKVNKLDLDLFHECNSELDHRINKVEDFEMTDTESENSPKWFNPKPQK